MYKITKALIEQYGKILIPKEVTELSFDSYDTSAFNSETVHEWWVTKHKGQIGIVVSWDSITNKYYAKTLKITTAYGATNITEIQTKSRRLLKAIKELR